MSLIGLPWNGTKIGTECTFNEGKLGGLTGLGGLIYYLCTSETDCTRERFRQYADSSAQPSRFRSAGMSERWLWDRTVA